VNRPKVVTGPAPEHPLRAESTEPIVVTASKRPIPLDDLPFAISVVPIIESSRDNAGSGTASLADATEGLALTGQGPGRNRLFIRGVADSAFNGESQSTVAVMLDDARLTYSAPDPDIRLVDVNRVEILKGPQGSLYGTGALGGIYHIVTNRAALDSTSLKATLGGEAVGNGGFGYSGSAIANLPLIHDRAALRLIGYYAEEPGWVDTGLRNNSNSTRVTGGRVGLGLDAGNAWRLDVTGFAQFIQARDSQYVYLPGVRSRPSQAPEPHDNDLRHLSARFGRHAGGLDVVISSALTWHEVQDTYDATIGAAGLGLAKPGLLGVDRNYRVWDSEFRASGAADGIGWLAGLSHINARQTGVWTLFGTTAPASLVLDDDRRSSQDTAAFGELTFSISDRLKLSLGGRLFRSTSSETRLLPTGPVTQELHRTGVTPSAALAWRPQAGRLIYVRYGSAFRQGGTDINAAGQLESLKNDELKTIEAGWRETMPGGGRLDLGVHYARWENVQSDMLRSDGLIEAANAGDARIAGFELTYDQPFGRDWHLSAGATFEHAVLVRNTLGISLDDTRLPVVPEYTVRTALRRDFYIGRVSGGLGVQLRYVGPARLSFDPALDRRMGGQFESRLEGHARLDGFEWGIAVENLFGGTVDGFAYGNPLRISTMRQYTPQRPFAVSTTLTRKF
jgi:iron complex outermembrane receptor protein